MIDEDRAYLAAMWGSGETAANIARQYKEYRPMQVYTELLTFMRRYTGVDILPGVQDERVRQQLARVAIHAFLNERAEATQPKPRRPRSR